MCDYHYSPFFYIIFFSFHIQKKFKTQQIWWCAKSDYQNSKHTNPMHHKFQHLFLHKSKNQLSNSKITNHSIIFLSLLWCSKLWVINYHLLIDLSFFSSLTTLYHVTIITRNCKKICGTFSYQSHTQKNTKFIWNLLNKILKKK